MRPWRDISGQRFGLLTAITSRSDRHQRVWICQCDCGQRTIVATSALTSGNTKSCGCLRVKTAKQLRLRHGATRTSTWRSWQNMIVRCKYTERSRYKDYGGRGITVCKRWLKFENFLADMGERPDGRTLDRIDNDRGYSPKNCRWATAQEQRRNRRGNKR